MESVEVNKTAQGDPGNDKINTNDKLPESNEFRQRQAKKSISDGEISTEDVLAPDTTQPLRILCLDGGGVRGISSLCILKELMLEVAREKNRKLGKNSAMANGDGSQDTGNIPENQDSELECVKPCDYFDLICGTSTGGLIALMLGRMKYTVDDAIKKYASLAEEVFTSKSKDPRAKYNHEVLEKCIQNVIEGSPIGLERDALMEDLDGCKTFVVATSLLGDAVTPYLMRTYKSTAEPPGPFPGHIWECARATSAAPTFFLPITINSVTYGESSRSLQKSKDDKLKREVETSSASTFGDGGTTANNPTLEALAEIGNIWPFRKIGCVVSLGTGVEKRAQLIEHRDWLSWALRKVSSKHAFELDVAKYCVQVTTSSEKVHGELMRSLKTLGWLERYFRLNVPHNVGEIILDDWAKVPHMKRLTEDYMKTDSGAKAAREKLGVMLFDPESYRVRDLNSQWGYTSLVPVKEPDFQSSLDPRNFAGSIWQQNAIQLPREGKPYVDAEKCTSIKYTWPYFSNRVQSLIFYNYDKRTNSTWNHQGHKNNSDSMFFDRRDEGESALAVLEITSKCSFVSTKFVKKWNLQPLNLPLQLSQTKVRVGGTEVSAIQFVWLTFRCHGFGMKTQRQWFRVLDSDEFEILFGEDITKKGTLRQDFGVEV